MSKIFPPSWPKVVRTNLFMSFCTIFSHIIWNDIKIIWDENIVYFFNWEINLFWTNKKFVYLIFINKLWWYHPKLTNKNLVQKDMNKFRACLKSYVSLYIYTISENVKNYSAFIWQSSEFSKIRVLKVHYFHLPRKKISNWNHGLILILLLFEKVRCPINMFCNVFTVGIG